MHWTLHVRYHFQKAALQRQLSAKACQETQVLQLESKLASDTVSKRRNGPRIPGNNERPKSGLIYVTAVALRK